MGVMTTTKVTAKHIKPGMVVRSKYLRDGWYTVVSAEVIRGINTPTLVLTVADEDGNLLPHPRNDKCRWFFGMNSKFEVAE
jgi:hypothetical protein